MNRKGAKDAKILFFSLIGVADQINHHALLAIFTNSISNTNCAPYINVGINLLRVLKVLSLYKVK